MGGNLYMMPYASGKSYIWGLGADKGIKNYPKSRLFFGPGSFLGRGQGGEGGRGERVTAPIILMTPDITYHTPCQNLGI